MIKIEKDKDGKVPNVWIFSDPHYNHKNICRGTTDWRTPEGEIPTKQTRDFPNLEKMNSAIVNNINNVVMQDDVLICLGDWSFGGFDSIKEFRDRIVCKTIHLILGNHDNHIKNNRNDCQELFTSVSRSTTMSYKSKTFELFHYPISSWENLNKGVIHLHGHVHLPPNLKFGKGKKMDVGMDGHPTFGVYNMDNIIKMMDKRESISDMLFDHHTDEMLNVVG